MDQQTRQTGGRTLNSSTSCLTPLDRLRAGRRIPVSLISKPLLDATNEKLSQLGYEPLDAAWNTVTQEQPGEPSSDAQLIERVMEAGALAPIDGSAEFAFRWAVVLEDHGAMRWTYDPVAGVPMPGDGDVEFILVGAAADFASAIKAHENVGQLIRDARLRHLSGATALAPAVVRQNIQSIVSALRGWAQRAELRDSVDPAVSTATTVGAGRE